MTPTPPPVRVSRGRTRLVGRLGLPVSLGLIAVAIAAAQALAAPPVVTTKVKANSLTVTGTKGADTIVLRLAAGDPTRLEVDAGGDGSAEYTLDRSKFAKILVKAGDGDDTLRIDQTNGVFTDTEATSLDGESGNDLILGGSASETLIGGADADTLDGGYGPDTVLAGSGDDVIGWDPGDGSDTIEGGTGADRLAFNGSNVGEAMAVSANGGRVSFTRNVATIALDLDDVERIDVRALGGADTLTVDDLTGTDLGLVSVDLASSLGTGDTLADTVTVRGTDGPDSIGVAVANGGVEVSGLAATVRITGSETIDTLAIGGLTGADALSVDPAVANLIQVVTVP